MIRSMTGFGRADGDLDGETFAIELSAVNHRNFECSVRLPNGWNALEAPLRDVVRTAVSRGKISVYVRRDRGASAVQSVRYDAGIAKQYVEATRDLAKLMNTTEALSLDVLAQLEGVLYQEEKQHALETVQTALERVLTDAIAQFEEARQTEGAALAEDIRERVGEMEAALASVEERIPELNAAYEVRLKERVRELNAEAGVKEERLALEVALMADKSDVNEEAVRLRAHFERAHELLASADPVGRDLNFLTQEMQREINTLGSKLRDIGVTREVLRMKSELEKMREQVQNVE